MGSALEKYYLLVNDNSSYMNIATLTENNSYNLFLKLLEWIKISNITSIVAVEYHLKAKLPTNLLKTFLWTTFILQEPPICIILKHWYLVVGANISCMLNSGLYGASCYNIICWINYQVIFPFNVNGLKMPSYIYTLFILNLTEYLYLELLAPFHPPCFASTLSHRLHILISQGLYSCQRKDIAKRALLGSLYVSLVGICHA